MEYLVLILLVDKKIIFNDHLWCWSLFCFSLLGLHFFELIWRYKAAGLYNKQSSIFGFFDTNLSFHKTMFVAGCNSIIVLAVWCEPLYFSADIFVAQIAFGAHDLHVFKDIFLGIKLPGDVFLIIVKNNLNLLLFGLWSDICVKRDPL